jgi:hypothetical protein
VARAGSKRGAGSAMDPASAAAAAATTSIAWLSGEGLEHRKEINRELGTLVIDRRAVRLLRACLIAYKDGMAGVRVGCSARIGVGVAGGRRR